MYTIEELTRTDYVPKDHNFRKTLIATTDSINKEIVKQINNNITEQYVDTMIQTLALTTEPKEITFQYTPELEYIYDMINHKLCIRPKDGRPYVIYIGYVYETNKINPFVSLQLNSAALNIPFMYELQEIDAIHEVAACNRFIIGDIWNTTEIIEAIKTNLVKFNTLCIEQDSEQWFVKNRMLFKLKAKVKLNI